MPGIVVVTFNSAEVIEGCLEACLRVPRAQVVVVDNASEDNTVERVQQWSSVTLIANSRNRGFAAAVNQGVGALDAPAVLILNPDATPVTGIEALEQVVAEDRVGAATGRLLNPDGTEQHGFNVRALPSATTLVFELLGLNRIWPGNPVNRRYRTRSPQHRGDVEQPAGAFLMLRRSAWAELGGFDEGFYPIWFEDVDYCKRLMDRHYRIVYIPDAIARHQGGHSAGKLLWHESQSVWYGSLLRYASKHFSGASRAVVCAAVILGSFARSVMAIPRVGVAIATSVLFRVVCLTGQCLRTGERGRSTPVKPPAEEQFKQSR
jgi:GT2 family glycosyltransferase